MELVRNPGGNEKMLLIIDTEAEESRKTGSGPGENETTVEESGSEYTSPEADHVRN